MVKERKKLALPCDSKACVLADSKGLFRMSVPSEALAKARREERLETGHRGNRGLEGWLKLAWEGVARSVIGSC